MKYRPDIDGLHALAIVPVVLYHAGFSIFSNGFVEVEARKVGLSVLTS